MKITVELNPEQAAGLLRFAEKFRFDVAASVLYPHVSSEIREAQVYAILEAVGALQGALVDAGARSWPWIETGEAR